MTDVSRLCMTRRGLERMLTEWGETDPSVPNRGERLIELPRGFCRIWPCDRKTQQGRNQWYVSFTLKEG